MDIDYTKISPEVRKKIEAVEKNRPEVKQLEALSDIGSMLQELVNILDDTTSDGFKKDIGAILLDIRESLNTIKSKEDKEMPDYAKPVVKAISDLEKSLSKLELKSEYKPTIKVDAPKVEIPKPDLKELNKLIKTELPKALEKAIKNIPQVELPKAPDYKPIFKQMLEQLASIDTASRLKPEVREYAVDSSNRLIMSGLTPNVDFDYIDIQQTSSTVETYVFKTGGSGGTTVQTIVVTYTSSAKTDLDTVEYS